MLQWDVLQEWSLCVEGLISWCMAGCMSTQSFSFLPCSFAGTLYSPCGGPEDHERQCRGLQVHYPLLSGGVHHRRFVGERHYFTHLRYSLRLWYYKKIMGLGGEPSLRYWTVLFFKVALWCFMWAGSHAPELLCVPHWAERTGVSCGHRHKCSDVRLSVCFCSRSRHERWLGAWNESPGTEISVMPRS